MEIPSDPHRVEGALVVKGEPPLIAHVIFRLDVGGLENGVVNLVNNIPESRYRQVIICLQDFTDFRKRLTSPNVRVIALHKKQGKDLGIYLRLWKIFRELRPDIVHTRNLGTIDAVFPAAWPGRGITSMVSMVGTSSICMGTVKSTRCSGAFVVL